MSDKVFRAIMIATIGSGLLAVGTIVMTVWYLTADPGVPPR